jgi:RsiW-degrading membrane proteinase PrsW (M82 family)
MTSAVSGPMTQSSTSKSDLRMAMIAGAGVTLSIAALLARMAGILAGGPTTLIVLIGAAIGIKVAFSYAAKAASAPSRAQVMNLVSTVGLAISGVTILAALPHLTKSAGIGKFGIDLIAQMWALTVLAVAAGSVRTLGWRTFVGAGTTGFLAVTALAVALGSPVVTALAPSGIAVAGRSSLFAVAAWVPLTEELCKQIPAAFVIIVALRRTAVRPSALDLMLLSAWTGAGFALYENAIYGRGFFQLFAAPPFTLLFPAEYTVRSLAAAGYRVGMTNAGMSQLHGGHLVLSALLGLGIGLSLLYKKRFRRPGLLLLAAALTSFLEHAVAGTFAVAGMDPPGYAGLLLTLTLSGYLSSILLIVGIGYVLYIERRAIGAVAARPEDWLRLLRPEAWLQLSAAEAQRRAVLLARAQLGEVAPASMPQNSPPPMAAGQESLR